MREPDEKATVHHARLGAIEISTWWEPTDLPYDGELEPGESAEHLEGWDCLVEARLTVKTIEPHIFLGQANLCANWGNPHATASFRAYLGQVRRDVAEEAIAALEQNVAEVANGKEVDAARRRQAIAKSLIARKTKV